MPINDYNSVNDDKVGAIREAQREKPQEKSEEPSSWDQVREQQQEKKSKLAKAKESINSFVKKNPARKAISSLLRSAWTNLITSWGATILWIDIHVFAEKVVGDKLFCKLGEEWADLSPAKTNSGAEQKAGESIGLLEKMGCCCLNLGCFFILLGFVGLIAILIYPTQFIGIALNYVWDFTKDVMIGK